MSALHKAMSKRNKGEDGFTLIELLVVVVILGILIAIAIPTYLSYRKSANDKAAQSDLRNAISTFEVCNSDAGYPISSDSAGTLVGCDSQNNKISLSSGTTVKYITTPTPATAGNVVSYIIFSGNSGGTTNKVYCYNSSVGGSVKTAPSGTVAAATTCP
jgi:type IV pilus assembly protein PilA